jgi:hypothetical protein
LNSQFATSSWDGNIKIGLASQQVIFCLLCDKQTIILIILSHFLSKRLAFWVKCAIFADKIMNITITLEDKTARYGKKEREYDLDRV